MMQRLSEQNFYRDTLKGISVGCALFYSRKLPVGKKWALKSVVVIQILNSLLGLENIKMVSPRVQFHVVSLITFKAK